VPLAGGCGSIAHKKQGVEKISPSSRQGEKKPKETCKLWGVRGNSTVMKGDDVGKEKWG